MKFSANLGFLWKEKSLPDQIRAAAKAGFDAVECHFPYDTPWQDTKAAMSETGMEMIGLNTLRDPEGTGAFGLSAVVGKEEEARRNIDQAIEYAANIGCKNIHVMAGTASGEQARKTFISQLTYATGKAAAHGITILIEPINPKDGPGYFMNSIGLAASIVEEIGADNLKVMFDCYHISLIHGEVVGLYKKHEPIIGHVQIAAAPDRSEPDHGDVNYPVVLKELEALGYDGFFGAEYAPRGTTDEGLGWLADMRK